MDSIFVENLKIGGLNLSLGRRKSWIVPIQMMLGGMLWVLSGRIEEIMNQVSKTKRNFSISILLFDEGLILTLFDLSSLSLTSN